MNEKGFKTALVTGGAGFIGSHIAKRLVGLGLEVNIIDDLSVGTEDNLPGSGKVRFFKEDVASEPFPADALDGVDVVFHDAARVSIRNSFDDALRDARTNVLGTVNLLKACAGAGIRRFIYASSMAVYDTSAPVPLSEGSPVRPSSPYGASKLAGEEYTRIFAGAAGFDYTVLRYFNTYGPGQGYTPYVGVITIFTEKLLKGEPPVIFGDGGQMRDFIHVDDVAEANVRAMLAPEGNETINVGTGQGTSVNELAGWLTGFIAPELTPSHGPAPTGEPRDSIADIGRLRDLLGLEPSTDIRRRLPGLVESRRRALAAAG